MTEREKELLLPRLRHVTVLEKTLYVSGTRCAEATAEQDLDIEYTCKTMTRRTESSVVSVQIRGSRTHPSADSGV